MWQKPCRTFHPWCPCIKTRCLSPYVLIAIIIAPVTDVPHSSPGGGDRRAHRRLWKCDGYEDITVTSQWHNGVSNHWRLANIKAPYYWPFVARGSPYIGLVMWKAFPYHDIIMNWQERKQRESLYSCLMAEQDASSQRQVEDICTTGWLRVSDRTAIVKYVTCITLS